MKDTPTKDTSGFIKTEPADISEASAPNSPITPREEIEPKPVIGTASSTTDHDIIPDSGNTVSENVTVEPVADTVCLTDTVDSDQLGKDLSNSVTECLVEVNVADDSGRNTPSPCPSTAGSLHYLQCILNFYNVL